MASENNINSLASDAPDVDTSELEILSVDLIPTDEELEMDADTFSLGEREDEDEHSDHTVSSLRSDLRSREERISTLQYDIEQLRSRWSGLEKEIEAREDLTVMLQNDLKAAHKKLSEKDREATRLQREIDDLVKRLDSSETVAATAAEESEALARKIDVERASSEQTIKELSEELAKVQAEATEQRELAESISVELDDARERLAASETPEQRYIDARQEVTELRDYIDGRQADWARQEEEIERLTNALSERRDRLVKRERELSRLETNLNSIDSERGRLEAMLKIARSENADLRSRHSSARKQIIDFSTVERRDFEETIAEQRGTILDQKHRIQALEESSARFQEYADGLRVKLSDAQQERSTHRDELQGRHDELDVAQQTIADLEKRLQETSALASDATAELDELRERFNEDDIADLEKRLREATVAADEATAELDELRERFDEKEIADLREELQETTAIANAATAELSDLRERFDEDTIADLQEQLQESSEIASAATAELDQLRERFDEEAIAELQEQLEERSAIASAATAELDQLRERFDEDTIADLEKQLQETFTLASETTAELNELRGRFDKETTTLQSDLKNANESLEHQTELNERLGAELSEVGIARNLLAERVSELEEQIKSSEVPLRSQIASLEESLENAKAALAKKENAITALLNELANKSRSIESIGEIENVIHEIDGRISEHIEDPAVEERDRHTRLLTGTVDGQDLRFPLFKDRLTIGRTTNNDIQLRAQYVSRRHAVVFHQKGVTKIVDWQSKNGVYVNKARVSEQILQNGDLITIGTAEFRYEERSRREPDHA